MGIDSFGFFNLKKNCLMPAFKLDYALYRLNFGYTGHRKDRTGTWETQRNGGMKVGGGDSDIIGYKQ